MIVVVRASYERKDSNQQDGGLPQRYLDTSIILEVGNGCHHAIQ
jgi:hypothetical protein